MFIRQSFVGRPSSVILVGVVMFIWGMGGCRSERGLQKPQGWKFERGNLPDKAEIPSPGSAQYITPQAFLDSLKSGKVDRVYFVKEFEPEHPEWILPLPNMEQIFLPDMYSQFQDRRLPRKPYYLICMFGDDSKRLAEYAVRYGYTCYYVDGGMYRLHQVVKARGGSVL